MIVSAPAQGNSIAPVPLSALLTPTGANSTETIPFQSVLDALEGLDATSGESVWQGQQDTGTPSKKAWPDPPSDLLPQGTLQYVAPQIPFVPMQELPQLTATPASPAPETETQENATPQEAALQEAALQGTKPLQTPTLPVTPDAAPQQAALAPQPSTIETKVDQELPAKLPRIATRTEVPDSHRTVAPQSSKLAPPKPLEIANADVPDSPRAAAPQADVPASAQPAIQQSSKPTPILEAPSVATKLTPARTRVIENEQTGRAVAETKTHPEFDAKTAQEPSSAIGPGQPQPAPAPKANGPAVSPVVPGSSRRQAEPAPSLMSRPTAPEAPAPKPEIAKAASKPALSPASAPGPMKTVAKSGPDLVPSKQVLPNETLPAPTAAPAPIPQSGAPAKTPPAPFATTSEIEKPWMAESPQPPSPSPKVKETGSRRVVASDKDVKDKDATRFDPAPLPAVTQSLPVSLPVTPRAGATPDVPELPTKSRSEFVEGKIAAASDTPLPANTENLAFAVHMLPTAPAPVREHTATVNEQESLQLPVSQPKPAVTLAKPVPQVRQDPTPANPRRDTTSMDRGPDIAPDAAPEELNPRVTNRPDSSQPAPTRAIAAQQWADVTASRPSDFNATSPGFVEPAHASLVPATQETHVILPELPKAPTNTDILLRLTGNDHSPAAIRVAERAGSVNVSVHSADPALRESLRSNLGELSSQLSSQGWKAEVVKPATTAQPESQQDSHGGREGSFQQQQQTFGGDRQPQRDRRTPGQWQQELEQHTSSGDARPGGKT